MLNYINLSEDSSLSDVLLKRQDSPAVDFHNKSSAFARLLL